MRQFFKTENVKTRADHSTIGIYFLTLAAAIISLFCSSCEAGVPVVSASESEKPFFETADFDPAVPAPETVIGYRVGEKAVRYDPLMRYLEALAASSDRITLKPYGKTHEGRTLVHLFITSPKNHKRLDQIKADNGKLADPRKLPNAAAGTKLIKSHPATAMMAYSIHGDELSSTDAAMQLAYQLVAGTDDQTKSLLDQVITIIDPLQNPDGRERHLASIEQRTGVISSTDGQHIQHNPMGGRTNHYGFDMNRDWVSLSAHESRHRVESPLHGRFP
ncbi:MAG: M14 family zinc carboxypeptidase [Planctomycetota bacterium]|jgi:murein tripeptide amidase MpaA